MRIHEYNTTDVQNIADLTAALADVNRLRILNLLLQAKELCVCDIERVLAVPQARVSRHLTILRNSGWVAARRDGRWMHYRLTDDTPMKRDLARAFRKHWSEAPEFLRDLERLRQPLISCCVPEAEDTATKSRFAAFTKEQHA